MPHPSQCWVNTHDESVAHSVLALPTRKLLRYLYTCAAVAFSENRARYCVFVNLLAAHRSRAMVGIGTRMISFCYVIMCSAHALYPWGLKKVRIHQ